MNELIKLINKIEKKIDKLDQQKSSIQDDIEVLRKADHIRLRFENDIESVNSESDDPIDRADREFFRLRQGQ
jgi:hypothetical protein